MRSGQGIWEQEIGTRNEEQGNREEIWEQKIRIMDSGVEDWDKDIRLRKPGIEHEDKETRKEHNGKNSRTWQMFEAKAPCNYDGEHFELNMIRIGDL